MKPFISAKKAIMRGYRNAVMQSPFEHQDWVRLRALPQQAQSAGTCNTAQLTDSTVRRCWN
jgi:hypothetical protein